MLFYPPVSQQLDLYEGNQVMNDRMLQHETNKLITKEQCSLKPDSKLVSVGKWCNWCKLRLHRFQQPITGHTKLMYTDYTSCSTHISAHPHTTTLPCQTCFWDEQICHLGQPHPQWQGCWLLCPGCPGWMSDGGGKIFSYRGRAPRGGRLVGKINLKMETRDKHADLASRLHKLHKKDTSAKKCVGRRSGLK